MEEFRRQLETLLNQCSMESGSDTPDFILAAYMVDCLGAFDRATRMREDFFVRNPEIVRTAEVMGPNALLVVEPSAEEDEFVARSSYVDDYHKQD